MKRYTAMPFMEEVFLLLGSNLGDRIAYIKEAVRLIDDKIGKVVARSSYYETAAWGLTSQPEYINQVVCLESSLPAMKLLDLIWSIEGNLERKRVEKWGPRTIDIDILLYGSEVLNTERLIVPHKHLHERRFALMPLNEIAPNFVHPVLKKTISELLLNVSDHLEVRKLKNYN